MSLSSSSPSRLAVTRLTLTDFRCYAQLRIEADARPVVLTGPNGAGKTNLLEALSFLAPGRGLRRARLIEVGRREAPAERGWAVAATIERAGERFEVGTGRDPLQGGEKRLVRIDGRPARGQVELGEIASAVWLTPPMDRLFGEGASGRRRFLDRLVYGVDPAHAGRLTAYEHALRERGRLLKEAGADGKWLDAVEDVLVHKGVAVAAARRDMVGRLIRVCLAAAGPFPVPGLALEGEVENWLAAGPALEAEERMRRRLAEDRHQDAEHGVTSVGPHRSDLVVRHLGHGVPARDCSTGEQKALLVSIILAQARVVAETRGMAPLVLLDEVAAHLDARRRAALFDAVSAVGAQAWMTGTDLSLFADLGERAQYFEIREATATRLPI